MSIRTIIYCITFLFIPLIAIAEPGPGIPNISYPLSKVGDMISDDNGYQETTAVGTAPPGVVCSDIGRTALIGFHRGWVFAGYEGPGSKANSRRGQCVVDFSDPANPSIHQWFDNGASGQHSHGYAKRGPELHLGLRYSVSDTNNITTFSPRFFDDYGSFGRGGMFAGWHVDFKWNYNPVSGLHSLQEKEGISNQVTTHSQIDLIGETGIGGSHPFLLGNLLIFASDQADRGIATYDVSDPKNPKLLDVLNGGVGIGAYWAEIWKHYIIFPRRRQASSSNLPGVVHIVDFSDPTDLKYVAEIPINGQPMYGQMKDHFAFVDATKIDLSPLETGGQPQVVVNFDENSRNVDMSQFVLPVGNLLFAGGIQGGSTKWQGMTAWVHDANPDNQCPEVADHYPKNGELDYPTTAPISILIHETLETGNLELGRTFIVREVGTATPLDGRWVYTLFDVLSFNPYTNFKPGTDYEVILTDDAFTDAVGNSICDTTPPGDGIAYRFSFRTADGVNPHPIISNFSMNKSSPIALGDTVSFNISATDNNNLEYRLDFGDGNESNRSRTNWTSAGGTSISATETYQYTKTGNFKAILQVREEGTRIRLSSQVIQFVVNEPLTSPKATQSSQLALDEVRRRLWVVNPDNNTVAILHADSNTLLSEIKVSSHPISIALDNAGRAWVACRDSDELYVLGTSGTVLKVIKLDYGASPVSVVFTPDRTRGFAALQGKNQIATLDPANISLSGMLKEMHGANYELLDSPSNPVASVTTISDATSEKYSRRFFGTNSQISHSILNRFEDQFPRSSRARKRRLVRHFALEYRGMLDIPQSGDYKIYLNIQGPSTASLKLGDFGEIAIPSGGSATRTDFISATLPKGRVPIVVSYLHNNGLHFPHFLQLQWEGPGLPQQIIPKTSIFPEQENRKLRTMAVSPDASKLLVTQFISDDNSGKIFVYDLNTDSWDADIELLSDEKTHDTGASARGVPNYLLGLAITPDGTGAWYAGKKDNIFTAAPTFQTSVRAVVGPVNIGQNLEPLDSYGNFMTIDIDNHSLPSSISYDPTGTKLLTTMLVNNELIVLDVNTRKEIERVQVGLAPTAVVADSVSNKIFVKNFLSRDISVFDGTRLITQAKRDLAASFVTTVSTVSSEKLPANVLRGKQVFYSARDLDDHTANPSRMALDGYMSCASCHLDGGHDGRSLKRGALGEGFRNTATLRGSSGLGHGNLHWSANFDEIQDFELDMVNVFGGRGFSSSGPKPSMGAPNAGNSADLDALAAYVSSLGKRTVVRTPYRQANSTETALGKQGRVLFNSLGCETCHLPTNDYTDSTLGTSPLLHNIGTLKSTSGNRLGAALSGIDTPSLLGLHATAPYLHDGSAPTISTIFEQFDSLAPPGSPGRAHDLSSLSSQEKLAIYQFLLEIDGGPDKNPDAPETPASLRLR